mgnify:CR=1 FL=1
MKSILMIRRANMISVVRVLERMCLASLLLILAAGQAMAQSLPASIPARVAGMHEAQPERIMASVKGAGSIMSTTWNTGDVFVAVSGGSYKVYTNAGVFKETISDGLGGFTTGAAFNPSLTKLYTTNFSNTKVVVYDNASPHTILQVIDAGVNSPGGHSESVVFASNGEFYVGHPDGNDDIHKYDAAGNFLTSFDVAIENRGSDWMDLAADQATIFYTSEGGLIKRFNVGTNTQLANFASIGGISYALRLLPPGDGSGGLLVANTASVKRLDGTGAVVQTYDAAGENCWFALNLDPNGTSFWSGDFCTSNFYRFNIATGVIEVGPINTGTGGSTVFGICLKGEPTAAIEPTCPLTQGFWKNHPEDWPVTSLTLGTVSYTQAQLLAILSTPSGSKGSADASLILAKQLIAAKLNIANGSPAPPPVPATIAAADAAINGSSIPMGVTPSSPLGQTMTSLAATLDAYNNGLLTPECKDDVSSARLSGELAKEVSELIPTGYALEPNYPNPFNPETRISYSLREAVHARLVVYDVLGREVKVLVDRELGAGHHVAVWDATDARGSQVPSGVYFYSLTAGSFKSTQKMVLMR